MSRKSRSHNPFRLPLMVIGAVTLLILVDLALGDGFLGAKGPKFNSPSPVQITVTSPNNGETFHQGKINTISWKGGNRAVAVGLATVEADTNHAIAISSDNTSYTGPQRNGYTGQVIGFIKTTENGGVHVPDSSIDWDGLKVCNFHLNMDPDSWCVDVTPGNYKIFVWSEGEGGQSMCIASGKGPTGSYTKNESSGCNWDLSDQLFTIVAP